MGIGFVVLLVLQLALAALELPPLPVPLAGTRAEEALIYVAIYAGIGAESSISIVKTLMPGVVGAGLGFLFLPRGKLLRAGIVLASGGVFAVTTFLLGGPVTRSIGEVPWFVCVVIIGAAVTYLGGRVASRHAA